MVELLIDLLEFPAEGVCAFRRECVIAHEGVGQVLHEFEDAFGVQQNIDDLLLWYLGEELLPLGVHPAVRNEGGGCKLVEEVENQGD